MHENCVLLNTFLLTFSICYRLDTLLKKLENGSVRWLGDSPLFLEAKISLEKAKRKEQLEKLHRLVTERWFLLQLMKKYAGTVYSIITVKMVIANLTSSSLLFNI